MISGPRRFSLILPICLVAALLAEHAMGFNFRDAQRWAETATDGSGLLQGDPTTVTWSIIPDGQGGPTPSGLIAFFDSLYPGGSGDDLTQRPWFPIFDDSFGRIAQLSGLSFVYEPNDDGTTPSFGNRGALGVRGDIRIQAYPIDGQVSPSVAAFSFYPPYSEMTIDTDNVDFFGDAENDSRGARNVITHEISHGIGVDHLDSDDTDQLLEPMVLNSYDGPQLGDIIAYHRGYGDFYEKSNNGAGNDVPDHATALGALVVGSPLRLGTDADDTVVERGDTDFVSIDDDSDTDYFSFTIDQAAEVELTLTPKGPTYLSARENAPQFPLDTSILNNLTLTLIDRDGTTPLVTMDAGGRGEFELIDDYVLDEPGTYFARVTGVHSAPQLYQLDITAVPEPGTLFGVAVGLGLVRRRR